MSKKSTGKRVMALRFRQWLEAWNNVHFDDSSHKAKPGPYAYLFTMPANTLRALSGVYRRAHESGKPRSSDIFIQRGHSDERSTKIAEFVKSGFPWCEMSAAKKESGNFDDLRKPGWLPTAIIVNILSTESPHNIAAEDMITIEEPLDGAATWLRLPDSFSGPDWRAKSVPPLEVIDGQHRLWAFDSVEVGADFELPVVAFHGLDRSWQAYLFWSINVSPKRINPSLAFDLYPLLRTEDWLEKSFGHSIYREARAQELVESLWGHSLSPWHQRINMLGETGSPFTMVSQAAWVRSLLSSYLKTWDESGAKIGGLFGAPRGQHEMVLPWSRAQQAAFLITVGREVRKAVAKSKDPWAVHLRTAKQKRLFEKDDDAAFYGEHSLLSTDQGIRGVLQLTNDVVWLLESDAALSDWIEEDYSATDKDAVTEAFESLQPQPVRTILAEVSSSLGSFDWRTSGTPDLSDAERHRQAAYRGSGGYRLLRENLLKHVASDGKSGRVKGAASAALEKLVK